MRSLKRSIVIFLSIAGAGFTTDIVVSAAETNNFVIGFQGIAEVLPVSRTEWQPAQTNQVLRSGDRIRTGERSRAEVYLASSQVWKLGELSEGEIPPPRGTTFKRGIFHIFNRERNTGSVFSLPGWVAAIRGTEFVLEVSDNVSTISVLDGAIEVEHVSGPKLIVGGQEGLLRPGLPPEIRPINAATLTRIQWGLYFPAVLDAAELPLVDANQQPSVNAYTAGDLPAAFQLYQWDRPLANSDDRLFRATMLAAVGQVEAAIELLSEVPSDSRSDAIAILINAVLGEPISDSLLLNGDSSSKAVALSYYWQGRADFDRALSVSRLATERNSNSPIALVRQAELEFGAGRSRKAEQLVHRSLELAPRSAPAYSLLGFIASAHNERDAALSFFEKAVELDRGFPNAWLGRGLAKIRLGRRQSGHVDLLIAAALEPQRAFSRSYLGKSFDALNDPRHARQELDLATLFDANDPTGWLYSALLHQKENRINEAIRDLNKSIVLNDNRAVFRSSLLLDQDRAVRSANLASIYQEAGMEEVSMSEAVNALLSDYGNHSAHLFLANSYNALRDASLINLRYETAVFSEYLLANLLSPVGGTRLSPQISAQEYSSLFEGNRFGFSTESLYRSDGTWGQRLAHYGVVQQSAYAFEEQHRFVSDSADSTELEQTTGSAFFHQQLTLRDTVYLQAVYDRSRSLQFHEGAEVFRNKEVQDPNIFVGFHRKWQPGSDTVLLLSNFRSSVDHSTFNETFFAQSGNDLSRAVDSAILAVEQSGRFESLGAEVQHILEGRHATLIAGLRHHSGTLESEGNLAARPGATDFFSIPFLDDGRNDRLDSDYASSAGYVYLRYELSDQFHMFGGMALERQEFPGNANLPPYQPQSESETAMSPKAGLSWTPDESVALRAVYTRSLQGYSSESSARLEPAQVFGFASAYRSLIPDAAAPGSMIDGVFASIDVDVGHSTYFGVGTEWLRSDGDRDVGLFTFDGFFDVLNGNIQAASAIQSVTYQEQSARIYVNHLLGEKWTLGAHYKGTWSDIEVAPLFANESEAATFHQFIPFAIFNHESGFFAQASAPAFYQIDKTDEGESSWQIHLACGYRLARRRAEFSAGVLNLFDDQFRAHRFSGRFDIPPERVFFTRLQISL